MTIKTNYPLMEHQQRAVDKVGRLKVGALFMDMGTGKTRTMIEIIKDKIDKDKVDKVIRFCPCAAKVNIKRELEKQLSDGYGYFIIVGIESMSSSIRLNSYLLDFVKKNRCLIVVDESSKIKNFKAKRTERIINLGKYCTYKYILNGTPVSRDERDLFSQLYFLDWRILGYKSERSFENNHVKYDKEIKIKVVSIENTEYLSKKIAPYSYQVKLDECADLPEKVYDHRYIYLNSEQQEQYQYLGNYLINEIDERKPSTIYRMFNILEAISAGFVMSLDEPIKRLKFLDNEYDNPRINNLLDIIKFMDGKIIIYCKYIAEIEALEKVLNRIYGKGSAVTFYGKQNIKTRNINETKFRNSARFLLTNKDSASFSMNWQFCHQMIFYNNDWKRGTRAQAEDRIHRIGQEHKCLYFDIIASNTIEEYILGCLGTKERLADRFKKDINDSKDLKDIIAINGKQGKEKIEVLGDLNETIFK